MRAGQLTLHDSHGVADDQLSAVVEAIRIRTVVSGGFACRGPWICRSQLDHPLKLIAMAAGRARLTTDGAEALELECGDVAVVHARSWLQLEGCSDEDLPPRVISPDAIATPAELAGADRRLDDIVIGGHIDLDDAGSGLLRHALPPLGCLRATGGGAASVTHALELMLDELQDPRAGSAYAIREHARLVVLEVLRAGIMPTSGPAGWLRVVGDELLRPAVVAMHADPGRAWTVADLARLASMSRTTFALRFHTASGTAPLNYLSQLRMLLAQQSLRHSEIAIGSLALELGYSTGSAFSAAFKRRVGIAPAHFRERARADIR